MSRLDRAIIRLIAQRACLDHAVTLVRGVAGPILELGLGNGRSYDHLRARLPDRTIFVFERRVAAHPGSLPSPEHLVLGDLRQTLPALGDRLRHAAALAHIDIASGETAACLRLFAEVTLHLTPLLASGAVVVSAMPCAAPGWSPLALPAGVAAGRYWLYRVG